MRRLFHGFLAASIFFAAAAQAAPSLSVGEAAEICRAGYPPSGGNSASTARRTACIALLDGVIGTVEQLAALAAPAGGPPARAAFCVPPTASYQELADVFAKTADVNPKMKDRAAAAIVLVAFASAYPCK